MKQTIFVAALWLGLVRVLVPSSPQTLPDVLTLHGYPYGKTAYLSRSEWDDTSGRPPISSQGHWKPSNAAGTLGHTHVECWAPIYAEITRVTFTLPCQAVMFHVSGTVGPGYGNVSEIAWDTPGAVVGDPLAVVTRKFHATFRPELAAPGQPRPENGWTHAQLSLMTTFVDGSALNTTLYIPFYSVGDPLIPDVGASFTLRADTLVFPASPSSQGNGHGQSVVECQDVYLPILNPIASRVVVPCVSYGYARPLDYPSTALDEMAQAVDPDLHAGNPGTILQHLVGDAASVINIGFIFDPAAGNGGHKTSLSWCQDTGAGSATVRPNEQMCGLLVVPFTVGSVVPPTDPPPSVACTGTWGWGFVDIGDVRRFMQQFTVAPSSPAGCVRPTAPSGG